MDSAGRIVLPREVRRQAGLQAGVTLEARVEDGRIVLEPRAVPVKLITRGRFTVAMPVEELPALTVDEVEETRGKVRSERERGEG